MGGLINGIKNLVAKQQKQIADNKKLDPNWYNSAEYKAAEAFKKENADLFSAEGRSRYNREFKDAANGGDGFRSIIAKGMKEKYDTYDTMLATAEQVAKDKYQVKKYTDAVVKAAEDPVLPNPNATQQAPGGANDELKRQKRLESLRMGLLSTRKNQMPGLGNQSLLSPAQNIYGAGLKAKLGA